MKKIVALLCALVMAMPCVMLTGCGSREEQLKMYVPGEYVDEDIFDGFKEFYKEKTGKSVDVVVTTFGGGDYHRRRARQRRLRLADAFRLRRRAAD